MTLLEQSMRERTRGETIEQLSERIQRNQAAILAMSGCRPWYLSADAPILENPCIEPLQALGRVLRTILAERYAEHLWETATDLPLTREHLRLIGKSGFQLCTFEYEDCDICRNEGRRAWFVPGGFEYPEEGSYYCDKCALVSSVAGARHARFIEMQCRGCPRYVMNHSGRPDTCWPDADQMEACIAAQGLQFPEDVILGQYGKPEA